MESTTEAVSSPSHLFSPERFVHRPNEAPVIEASDFEPMDATTHPTRRSMLQAGLVAASAATVASCTRYGQDPGAPVQSPVFGESTAAPPSASATQSREPTDSGNVITSIHDVPQGGGRILPAENVVVTQPELGEFKAFSALCTHAGCAVTRVENGTINCPCHGSRFRITNGSVVAGPAPRSLPSVGITVSGTNIMRA
ncbi:Rieske (2Fe-2S) protein [Streptomyces sp. NPDC093595]|uniref:Rieske (2Fe-2S) protein n=1 Tax=Streptomyces sp. NPDC093595 TaxID=3366045 RepID=UPI0037FABB19